MHLISPLISGVRGAENGEARIYKRGTKTTARTYTSFEGDGAYDASPVHALDANGGKELYVNELVTVEVYDSVGTRIREFVAGVGTGGVEVRSTGFTGADYATAESGTDKPTALKSILDLWYTRNGAPDWDIKLGSEIDSLAGFLGKIYPATIVSVKFASYGATGDGSTDDTAAIDLAISAVSAGGGGIVYFPPGTYIVSSEISVPSKVSLLGAGKGATTLRTSSATEKTLYFAGGSATEYDVFVSGFTFDATQQNTGTVAAVSGKARVSVYDCDFGQPSAVNEYTYGYLLASSGTVTGGAIRAERCTFHHANDAIYAILQQETSRDLFVRECTFVAPATYDAAVTVVGVNARIRDCKFVNSAVTTSTQFINIVAADGGSTDVSGCYFGEPGAAVVCAGMASNITGGGYLTERDNVFDAYGAGVTNPILPYAYDPAVRGAGVDKFVRLGTRDTMGVTTNIGTATSASIDSDQFGYVEVVIEPTTTGTTTLTLSDVMPLYSQFVLSVRNAGSSSRDVDINSTEARVDDGGLTTQVTSLTVGDRHTIVFRSFEDASGNNIWYASTSGRETDV